MTILFSDTFEAGSPTGWTNGAGSQGGGATLATTTAAKYDGVYGEDFAIATLSTGAAAALIKDVTPPANGVMSVWTRWYIVSMNPGGGTGSIRGPIGIHDNTTAYDFMSWIYWNGTNWRLAWNTRSHGVGVGITLSIQPTTGAWHQVELIDNWNAGGTRTITVLLDNVQVAQATDTSAVAGTSQPNRAELVFSELDSSGSPYGHIYVDDPSVADAQQSSVTVTTQTAVPLTLVANPGLWTDDLGSSVSADLVAAAVGTGGRYLKSPPGPLNASITFRLGISAGVFLQVPKVGTRTIKISPFKDASGGTVDFTMNLRNHSDSSLIQAFASGLQNVSTVETEVDVTETAAPIDWSSIDLEIVANQSG